jgi:rSAM/selenodomain-associated transferase 1
MQGAADPFPDSSCAMAVMAKASVAGRAKTRLIPLLGAENAARLNTAFLQDVAGNLLRARKTGRITPYFAFGPAGSEPFFRDHITREVGLIECSLPNFGDCLFNAIAMMFRYGHVAACVLNADSPTLPTEYLIRAARALSLAGDRAVLGPSADGGYYFLGLKQPHRRLFEQIDWSTSRVAEQTRQRAAELGLELVCLEPWYDVDEASTLRQLIQDLVSTAQPRLGVAMYASPHTRAALAHLIATTDLGLRLGVTVSPSTLATPP